MTFWIFNESNILAEVYHIWKSRYRSQLVLDYGPSKLLLYFIEYRLDERNNKYTHLSKEMSDKSLKFFCPPTRKWRPYQILMANIFKLHEYQTFGLMKMHKLNKIWFAINKFSLWKVWFTANWPSKILFFNICLFHFFEFQMTIVENLMEKYPFL